MKGRASVLVGLAAFACAASLLAAGPPPPSPMPARLLRTLAFDPASYDPARTFVATDLLLGDLLFHSPETLGQKAQSLGLSCQSCHPNGAAHGTLALGALDPHLGTRPGTVDLSTGFFRAATEDHVPNAVDIPSLRGGRFTAPYGHDGRTASLAEFTEGVVVTEFDGAPLGARRRAALVRYLQDLDFLPNSLLDAHGRLTARAGAAALRGEQLFDKPFAGFDGKSCASCHERSTFFRDGRVHRIGSGVSPGPHALDDGYETPTLLGTFETAPYFHDGRFATLGAVVAWFDESFGLGLDDAARADLRAYLEAVGAGDERADTRPFAILLLDSFAYLALLVDADPEVADDRGIWQAACARALEALALEPPPDRVSERISAAVQALTDVRERARAGEPLAELRRVVRRLERELPRLAADWAGARATH